MAGFIGWGVSGAMEGVLVGIVDAVVVCYGSEKRIAANSGNAGGGGGVGEGGGGGERRNQLEETYCHEAAYLFGGGADRRGRRERPRIT